MMESTESEKDVATIIPLEGNIHRSGGQKEQVIAASIEPRIDFEADISASHRVVFIGPSGTLAPLGKSDHFISTRSSL